MLFSAALAGLMLGACSSSDDLGGGNTPANKDGNGYVAVTINLPSQTTTRAGSENDQFKDGLASEYDVKNATLILFGGSDESSATFSQAYALNTAPWTKQNPDDGNITTVSQTITKEVSAPEGKAYALVVLNHNGLFSLDGTSLKFKGESSNFTGSFSDFLKKSSITENTTLYKDGFFMANAPLADKVGGSTEPNGVAVNTLVNLDGKICETEAEARAKAANIYVERAVAKVTLVPGSATTVDGTSVAFKVAGWNVDRTNKTTYLVRSTEDFTAKWATLATNKTGVAEPYRFVGANAVAAGLYRTYFAKDVNYDTDAKDQLSDNREFSEATGSDKPQYCFENTFDVAHQNDNQTTRVLIKAELNSGNDFYVINGDENNIYTKDEAVKEIKANFLAEYENWIKQNVETPTTVGESNVEVTISDEAGNVELTNLALTGVTYKTGGETTLPADAKSNTMTRLGTIELYKGGVSYYAVRIKHFGDDLTPWKDGEAPTPEVGKIYPSDNQDGNYLGRYGVLRNNWYELEVSGVKGLGSATVPEVTTVTDDELKSYIAVKINVLSWAKRTQSTILGQ